MQLQRNLLPHQRTAGQAYRESPGSSAGAAPSRACWQPSRKGSQVSSNSTVASIYAASNISTAAAASEPAHSTLQGNSSATERPRHLHALTPSLNLRSRPVAGRVFPLRGPSRHTCHRTRGQRVLVVVQWRPGNGGDPHDHDKAHDGGQEERSEEGSAAVGPGTSDAGSGGGGSLSTTKVLEVAEAYVEAWWRGVARGADAAAEALQQLVLVAPAVRAEAGGGGGADSGGSGHGGGGGPEFALMPDGVLHRRPLWGYDALIEQLGAQHDEYHRVQYRPVTSAAARPPSSSAYVLGEYRMQDVGGLAGHPATFRVSRGYCLFKLRVDPASGRVSRGWVRRQMTQEERDERVWDPVHVYPAPFPLERLHLTRDSKPDPRVMQEAACAWVAAQVKRQQPPKEKESQLAKAQREASAGRHEQQDGASGVTLRPAGKEEDGEERAAGGGDVLAVADAAAAAALGEAAAETGQEGPLRGLGGADGGGGGGGDGAGGGGGGGGAGVESISTAGSITSISPEVSSLGGGAGELVSSPRQHGGRGGSGGGDAAGLERASAEGDGELGRGSTGGGGDSGGGDSRAASEGAVGATAAATVTAEQTRLVDHVLAEGCRFLDAYGMWPAPEDDAGPYAPTYGGTYGGHRPQAVVGAKHVLERIQAEHKRCTRVEPLLYDVAVSDEHNIAFVHWVNFITPEPEPEPVAPPPLPPAAARTKHVRHRHHAHVRSQNNTTHHDGEKAASDVAATAPTSVKGDGRGGSSASAAVAASTAATAAATAASAAAQAATAAADVATTAAGAASVAASTANTAATIAATAATAAAFAAGDVEERPAMPPTALAAPAGEQPAPSGDAGDAALAVSEQEVKGAAVPTVRQPQAEHHGRPEAAGAEGVAGTAPDGEKASAEEAHHAVDSRAGSGGGGGSSSSGPRALGLQDLRISMPSIPPMPPMPQIQNQIQNLEEVLSAAAQRVAGAAGTAAAAASAAAAAATAVIMAETGGAAPAGGAGKDAAAAKASTPAAAAVPAPRTPLPYHQDCMAALLFNDDGTVSDVWLFRGPYHFERRLLRP